MRTIARVLYGRDAERARIGELLEAARASRSGVLVLRAEPGVGKTALLDDTRERAGDMHVLSARGVETESELPFAAIHQLLRPALEYVERIPAPQADALRGALGLAGGAVHERFLVFAACLSLLSELADRRPVLCLIDDAHWLDSASADALRFIARRLDAEGVVLLLAAREGDVRTLEAPDMPSLVLGGLDADAAAALLAHSLRVEPSPSVRDHLVAQTRGNALALLEVPTTLSDAQLAGAEPLPEALPLTRRVEGVFLDRVRRLPDDTQRLLLVAAADDSEHAGLIIRAAQSLGAGPRALDAAEQAGLVSVRGVRFDFRHPLVRSAIYVAATTSERRAAHRALAGAMTGDDAESDRMAWHLAASAIEHDEEIVCALEAAAERAEGRAGYMAAAKALERAAELSADGAARGRRLVSAARCARIAGADAYAVALANQALPLVDDPLLRAEIAYAVGAAEFRRGRPRDGLPRLIEGAREVIPLDPAKALESLVWASGAATLGADPLARAEVARLAATIDPASGDVGSKFVIQSFAGFPRADTTRGASTLADAVAWASTSDDAGQVFFVSYAALFAGDEPRFETLITRAIALARARGELGILAEALSLRSGRPGDLAALRRGSDRGGRGDAVRPRARSRQRRDDDLSRSSPSSRRFAVRTRRLVNMPTRSSSLPPLMPSRSSQRARSTRSP